MWKKNGESVVMVLSTSPSIQAMVSCGHRSDDSKRLWWILNAPGPTKTVDNYRYWGRNAVWVRVRQYFVNGCLWRHPLRSPTNISSSGKGWYKRGEHISDNSLQYNSSQYVFSQLHKPIWSYLHCSTPSGSPHSSRFRNLTWSSGSGNKILWLRYRSNKRPANMGQAGSATALRCWLPRSNCRRTAWTRSRWNRPQWTSW